MCGESLTVPQFSILSYFAKLCNDHCKYLLISGLCSKEISLIRERTELQPGLQLIRNHESPLALALGHHQRNCSFSICLWAQGKRRVGEGVDFGLVTHPAVLNKHISGLEESGEGIWQQPCHCSHLWDSSSSHFILIICKIALLRHNLHTIKFTHCNCTDWWFSANFMQLYNHHHSPVLGYFYQPQSSSMSICSHSLLPSPICRQPTVCFLYLQFDFPTNLT